MLGIVAIDECYLCGGQVSLVAKPGRTTRKIGGGRCDIPSDFEMPTCLSCGEEFVDQRVAEFLSSLQSK